MSDFVLKASVLLKNPTNLQQIINSINSQIKSGTKDLNVNVNAKVNTSKISSTKAIVKGLEEGVDSAKKLDKAIISTESSIEKLGKSAAVSVRRFGAFALTVASFYKLSGAIIASTHEALEFQDEMVKIGQVTGLAIKDLKALNQEITNLSTGFGVSSKDLSVATQILAQAGLTANQTKDALKTLAKVQLSPTFSKDITLNTEGAIAIISQFKQGLGALESQFDAINEVSKRFAIESEDVIAAVKRSGGSFEAAGGSLTDYLALFTSVRATTRESAESIATGFRTIFSRIQRPRTLDFLKTLGIELRDAEGLFVGPYEAIRRLQTALADIKTTDPRFSQITEELGGYRQISKVIPLLTERNKLEQARAVALSSLGSLTEDANRKEESLLNTFTKLREELSALVRAFVDDKWIRSMISLFVEASSAAIKMADSIKPLLPLLTTLAVFKIGNATPQFTKGFTKSLLERNSGGIVPGVGDKDTIPAVLTPGEFVLRKSAVKKIGVGNLRRMNIQGFNSGGLVGKALNTPVKRGAVAGIAGALLAGGSLVDTDGFSNTVKEIGSVITNFGVNLALFSLLLGKHAKEIEKSSDEIASSNENNKPIIDETPLINIEKKNKSKTTNETPIDLSASTSELPDFNKLAEAIKETKVQIEEISKQANISSINQPKVETTKKVSSIQGDSTTKKTILPKGSVPPIVYPPKINENRIIGRYINRLENRARGSEETNQAIRSRAYGLKYASSNQLEKEHRDTNTNIAELRSKEYNLSKISESQFNDPDVSESDYQKTQSELADVQKQRLSAERKRRDLVVERSFMEEGVTRTEAKLLRQSLDLQKAIVETEKKISTFKFTNKTTKGIKGNTKNVTNEADFEELTTNLDKWKDQLVKVNQSLGNAILAGDIGVLDRKRDVGYEAYSEYNGVGKISEHRGPVPINSPEYVTNDKLAQETYEKMANKSSYEKQQTQEELNREHQEIEKRRVLWNERNKPTVYPKLEDAELKPIEPKPITTSLGDLSKTTFIPREDDPKIHQVEDLLQIQRDKANKRAEARRLNIQDAEDNFDSPHYSSLGLTDQDIQGPVYPGKQELRNKRKNRFGRSTKLRFQLASRKITDFFDPDAPSSGEGGPNLNRINSRISNSKLGKLGSRYGVVGLAAASTAGSFLQNRANKNISEGKDSRLMAATGGALSSAATGAAFGSLIGPLGTALGGLGGAVYGATKSFNEADKQLKSVKFDKAITPLKEGLDLFAKGLSTPGAQLSNLSTGLIAFEQRLNTASGDDLTSAKGELSNIAPQIIDVFTKLANTSKTIDEFSAVAGENLARFSRIKNINFSELTNNFKKQIEDQNKGREAANKLQQSLDRSADKILSIQSFADAVKRAGDSVSKFEDQVLFGIQNNGNSSDFNNLSQNSFNRAQTLDKFTGFNFAGEIKDSLTTSDILPSLFKQIQNNPLNEDIYDQIKNALPANSPVTQNVIDSIKQEIGPTLDNTKFLDSLKNDFSGTVDKIRSKLTAVIEPYNQLNNIIKQAANSFSEKLSQISAKEQELSDKRVKLFDVISEKERFNADARKRDVNFSLLQSADNARVGEISGVKDNTPANLINILNGSTARLSQLNKDRVNSSPENLQSIIEAQSKEQQTIEKVTRALEFLGDAASRTALLQEKYSQIQSRHQAKTDIATDFLAGSSSDRNQMVKTFRLAQSAVQSNTVQNLQGENRSSVVSLLKNNPDQKFFGDKTNKEYLQKILESDFTKGGVDPKIAAMLSGRVAEPEEDKLLNQINKQFDESSKISQELLKSQTDNLTTINETLTSGFAETVAAIKEEAVNAINKDNQRKIDGANSKLGSINQTEQNFKKLSKYGIKNVKDLEIARGQLEANGELPKILESKKDLETRREKALSLIKGSKGKIRGVKDDVLTQLSGLDKTKIDELSPYLGDAYTMHTGNGPVNIDLTETATERVNKLFDSEQVKLNEKLQPIRRNLQNSGLGSDFSQATQSNYNQVKKDVDKLENTDVSSLQKEKEEQYRILQNTPVPQTNKISSTSQTATSPEPQPQKTLSEIMAEDFHRRRGFANGGFVPGTGNTDTVPAVLTPGEFVLTKGAVNNIGIDNLYRMNSQGFADGGQAGKSSKQNKREQYRIRKQEENERRRISRENVRANRKKEREENFKNHQSSDYNHQDSLKSYYADIESRKLAYKKQIQDKRQNEQKYQTKIGLDYVDPTIVKANREARMEAEFQEAERRVRNGLKKEQDQQRRYNSSRTITKFDPGSDSSPFFERSRINNRTAIRPNQKFDKKSFFGPKGYNKGGAVTKSSASPPNNDFMQSIKDFSKVTDKLTESLDNFPREITHTFNGRVELIINGAEVLTKIMPEIKELIENKAKEAVSKFSKKNFPELGE